MTTLSPEAAELVCLVLILAVAGVGFVFGRAYEASTLVARLSAAALRDAAATSRPRP